MSETESGKFIAIGQNDIVTFCNVAKGNIVTFCNVAEMVVC